MTAIVPRSDLSHDLGTSQKRWGNMYAKTIHSDTVTGGVKTLIDSKATKEEVAEVAGQMGGADAPNYYTESNHFHSDDNLSVSTPDTLWLNINGKGYKTTGSTTFDISEDATWDTKASIWKASTAYNVNDHVYITKGKFIYQCITAGTSSTLTPEFPTKLNATYNDGSVVWKCVKDYSTAANRIGKDFYIYALASTTTVPAFIISANSTVPLGSTADNSRKVGGFHCLCANVGTITGHTLSDYVAGDILPASVWDLSHRAMSNNEGMVYDEKTDIWVDIYGNSYTGTTAAGNIRVHSAYKGVWADGTSTEKFHWYKAVDALTLDNKYLPAQWEFMSFSAGSNQSTNIAGKADPNTTGGHTDTAGRRMVSNIGVEDCCGVLWQWGREAGFAFSSDWNGAYDANDFTGAKGSSYKGVTRVLFGGAWADGALCGSRSSAWGDAPLSLDARSGFRGVSASRKI